MVERLLRVPARYELGNPEEPRLFREIFPYNEVPRIVFDSHEVPLSPAPEFWITDTTFRDGQQARPPYSPEQIAALFDFLHRLGGKTGLIRASEFFPYSERDRKAIELCREKGHRHPEVTGWIRARAEDLKLIKELGLEETGILTSCSDYHIYLKLGWDRKKAYESYLAIVKSALEAGIRPRCHLEDLTRADFYGFVVPFVRALMELSGESGIPIKVRLCDTLGFGVSYPGAALPRSIPKLIHGLVHEAGVSPECMEWHGHNDFCKVHVNAATAWLYGCCAVNTTMLGYGERTGNPPLEAAVVEYLALKGGAEGIDTTVITEMAEYFRRELNADIPPGQPFVGSEFNTTRAGIHADGMAKNEEIYNIFDTRKLLKRPMGIAVTDKSGVAGVALWINMHFERGGVEKVSKKHPHAATMFNEVKQEYDEGRLTAMGTDELREMTRRYFPELFVSDLDAIKERARQLALKLVQEYTEVPEFKRMDVEGMEHVMREMADSHPFVQYCYVVNLEGVKITRNITQREEAEKYKDYGGQGFSDRDWFKHPLETGRPYVTGFYTSRLTNRLCITVSDVVTDESGQTAGVFGIDLKFEDLVKS